MKHEINLEPRLLKLIPTTEEDEKTLYQLDKELEGHFGRYYFLAFHSSGGRWDKVSKGQTEELTYRIVLPVRGQR